MTTQAPAAPQTKSCPYCAETIRAEATRCRYCHTDLERRRPGRLRWLASSPLLIVLSLVMGALGGAFEALGWFGVKASVIIRRDKVVPEEPFTFGPGDVTDVDVRVPLLIAAVTIGVLGSAAALLARRRPAVAALLFLAAGVGGLGISAVAGVNLVLVALSVLLLATGVATAVSTRRLAT